MIQMILSLAIAIQVKVSGMFEEKKSKIYKNTEPLNKTTHTHTYFEHTYFYFDTIQVNSV